MKLRLFPALLLLLFGLQLLTTSAALLKLRPPTVRPEGPGNWQDVMSKNNGNLNGKDKTGVIRLRPDGTNANDCGDEPCPADEDINLIRPHDNNDDDVDTDKRDGDLDDDVHNTDETEIDIVQVDMIDLSNSSGNGDNTGENGDDNEGQNIDDFDNGDDDQPIDTDDTASGNSGQGNVNQGTEDPEVDIIYIDSDGNEVPEAPSDGTEGNTIDFKGQPEVDVAEGAHDADVSEPVTESNDGDDEIPGDSGVEVIEIESDVDIPEVPTGSDTDDVNLSNNPDNIDRGEEEDDFAPPEEDDVNVNTNVNGQNGQDYSEIDVFEDDSGTTTIEVNEGANVDTIDENDERIKDNADEIVNTDNGVSGPSEVDTVEGDHEKNTPEPPIEESQFVDQAVNNGQDQSVDTYDEVDEVPDVEAGDDGLSSDGSDEVEVLIGATEIDTDPEAQNQNQGDESDDDSDFVVEEEPAEEEEFDDPNITIIPNDDPAWSNID